MPFRIETDAHLRAVLGTDGPAWANSYLRQRKHVDGDAARWELTAWFDAAISAGAAEALDRAASGVADQIRKTFRGRWDREELAQKLPDMIREIGASPTGQD